MSDWMETAERVHEGDYIGECDNGDLWVQSRNPYIRRYLSSPWTPFDRKHPLHWLIYWRSWRASKVVWLERADRC